MSGGCQSFGLAARRAMNTPEAYNVYLRRSVSRTFDVSGANGAEDGIRTRDPLLGKELGVSAVLASSRPSAKDAQLPSGVVADCDRCYDSLPQLRMASE